MEMDAIFIIVQETLICKQGVRTSETSMQNVLFFYFCS